MSFHAAGRFRFGRKRREKVMRSFESFSAMARGYSHIRRGSACEDASGHADTEGVSIAAVADGHGDSGCFRSAEGAKLAVDIALKDMEIFYNALRENGWEQHLLEENGREALLRQLIRSIVGKWTAGVLRQYEENPPTPEELAGAGEARGHAPSIPHIFGTTLLAAMVTERFYLILQQGDGRCIVVHADGRIDQPVPWDERCLMNFTTSLCNADAIESCRYYVGDMREDPILACYVITDGVEDAFDDQGGVNAFMGEVTGWLAGKGARGLEEYLGEFLPDFSRTGSADDVSVAGIADAAAATPFAERFFIGAERFELLGRLNAARSKLNSMQRKTDYLRARYEQAQESFAASERRLDEAKAEYDEWMDSRRVYEDSVEAAQKELAALDERLAGLESGK